MAVVLTLVSMASVAAAQYRNPYTGATWNNSFSRNLDMFSSMQQNFMRQMISAQMTKRSVAAMAGATPAPAAPTPAPSAPRQPLSATDFKPAAPGRPVLDAYLASLQFPPDQRATLRQVIEASIAEFEKAGRKNNVAASMAVALEASVLVLRGHENSDAESKALLQALNDLIAVSPEWKKMSAREKQNMSDSLLLASALTLNLAIVGKEDETSKKASVAIAEELLLRLTGSKTGS
jgi:hypothetical protein